MKNNKNINMVSSIKKIIVHSDLKLKYANVLNEPFIAFVN